MIRLVNTLCMAVLALAALVNPVMAQESRTVTAEGVAAIQGDARDSARDAALEDAQKRAVEQAIVILIDSQTQVENYQLITDKILSQTKGYIKHYNIAGETIDSGLLRVRINAEIALGRLSDDLTGIGILLDRMHKPRTMVMVAEQNIGRGVYAWWLGAQGEQTDISVVENTFRDKFTKEGFEFIDHEIAAKEIEVTGAIRINDLSAAQAKTLASQADAEVVIIGKAIAKRYGEIGGGRTSAQADLSARAMRIDTGQVIATATTHATAVHVSEIAAGAEALRKASNQAADELIEKILAVYAQETGGTRSVNITIMGLNKTQFAKFKDVLLNRVRGIRDLHERSFSGSTAKIFVNARDSAQTLSDEILLRNFGAFSVEVVSSTANALEMRVTPK
jgi:Flagellar assembly protein T, N-terminal domain